VTTSEKEETSETFGAPGSGTPALGQGMKTTSTLNAGSTTEEVTATTTTTVTWEENMEAAPRPRTPAGGLAWSGTVNFDVSTANGLSLSIAGEVEYRDKSLNLNATGEVYIYKKPESGTKLANLEASILVESKDSSGQALTATASMAGAYTRPLFGLT